MDLDNKSIIKLIKSQKKNFPLDQPFYTNDKIFNLDIETFFFNQWIFIGHQSRIKKKGEYFLFEVGNESIIIIRGDNNKNSHKFYRLINEIPTILLILIVFVVIFKPL